MHIQRIRQVVVSRNTHIERILEALRARKDRSWQYRQIDPRRYDRRRKLRSKSKGGVVVVVVEKMKRSWWWWRLLSWWSDEERKRKWNGYGKVFIGLGFCEGNANNKKGGAYLQSGGWGVSWPIGACHGRGWGVLLGQWELAMEMVRWRRSVWKWWGGGWGGGLCGGEMVENVWMKMEACEGS